MYQGSQPVWWGAGGVRSLAPFSFLQWLYPSRGVVICLQPCAGEERLLMTIAVVVMTQDAENRTHGRDAGGLDTRESGA